MPRQSEKLRVYLKPKVRKELEALCRRSCVSAAKVRKARILLLARSEKQRGGGLPDREILNGSACANDRWCEFVNSSRAARGRAGAGAEEAVASRPRRREVRRTSGSTAWWRCVCSKPPEWSCALWTMRLLADEAGRLQIVTSVCPETVRQCLKKTGLSLGSRKAVLHPPRAGSSAIRSAPGEDSRRL